MDLKIERALEQPPRGNDADGRFHGFEFLSREDFDAIRHLKT